MNFDNQNDESTASEYDDEQVELSNDNNYEQSPQEEHDEEEMQIIINNQ